MKKIILIPDSFKGTMSSAEICDIMASAIHKYTPNTEIIRIPVADGGEGSVDAFLAAMGGEKIYLPVRGPYMEDLMGFYGRVGDIAIIEMAAAAGLPLVGENLHAEKTTTYGVGQLIAAAAQSGAKKIIVGLGGSATNDGGTGAAAALGIKFLDKAGNSFVPVGETLHNIDKIDTSSLLSEIKQVELVTMCDIDNPLCGTQGAAAVFAPQKGADEATVKMLDHGLSHMAKIIKRDLDVEILDKPGAGAAGGMGGGMVAFLGSTLQMGIETLLNTVGFDNLLKEADMVFTGEGKIDGQSLRGKVVIGVSRRAKKQAVPVMAFVGDIGEGAEAAYDEGVTGIFSINRVALPFTQAKPRAKNDLKLTVENLVRVLLFK